MLVCWMLVLICNWLENNERLDVELRRKCAGKMAETAVARISCWVGKVRGWQ